LFFCFENILALVIFLFWELRLLGGAADWYFEDKVEVSKVHNNSSSRRLPVIICKCGYEILFLPDLKAMSQAIEKHILEHKKNGATDAEANRIELDLIAQILNKAADESEI
jgi:hypothetical protein